jgi:hypothetical protein
MRDEAEEQLAVNADPAIPRGPSIYSGSAGHVAEANLDTAVSPGPCLYNVPESHHSDTANDQGQKSGNKGEG